KSRADVRADAARALAAHARETGPRPAPARGGDERLPVYFSGCERRCGHPGGRWVDVLATGDGYRVAVTDGSRPAARDGAGTAARDVTAQELAGAVAAARTPT
ncbi:hypothetical protein RKE29_09465, partial [Streptomyces sp. B1866]|nr:hypothetical protein [Streptomyces sp. B1866]